MSATNHISTAPSAQSIKMALVGPLPPASGGMANQTLQLKNLLSAEGVQVEMVQVNAPYPALVANLKGIRALFRLFPYLWKLWLACGKVDLVHIMANSGWSWHLFAAPAIWIAHLRGTPVIVNYRGGEADSFFAKSFFWVKPSLDRASAIIVPSGFLEAVFKKYGYSSETVPNIIDFSRFSPLADSVRADASHAPRLLVARNLELIYDNATALNAFKIIHSKFPKAQLTIAGAGPELANLQHLSRDLEVEHAVTFTGRVTNQVMAELYRNADIMLNPTTIDNMPISILESLASGVPVVTTDAGGIPFMVEHEQTAILVPIGNAEAMAQAVLNLLENTEKMTALKTAGLQLVRQFTWPFVSQRLLAVYAQVSKSNIKNSTPKNSSV